MIDDNIINKVWGKGLKDKRYDPDFVRKDACGAWIIREKYDDRNSPFGWEVDHIYPEERLKKLGVPENLRNDIVNLRPLNWKNNISKGADYPHYQSKLKASIKKDNDGNELDVNISCEDEKEINDETQKQIAELFKGYRL